MNTETLFIVLFNVFALAMAQDITDFFPVAKGNLTKITWAHAVNNQTLLNEALANSVMMIEADVQIGFLINDMNVSLPVMAHPPNIFSDLSLEMFLNQTIEFNTNSNETKKGIKLDFKSLEAFEAALELLNNNYGQIMPVWINADIIPGPVNATTKPVNATEFLKKASNFTAFPLSIGWTTKYNADLANNSYTSEQIANMLSVIHETNVINAITFPVRAGLAAESLTQMQILVDAVPNSTLTIWSSADDPVNVDNLRTVIGKIGLANVFIDVPKELEDTLHLDTINSSSSKAKAFSVLAVLGLVVAALVQQLQLCFL